MDQQRPWLLLGIAGAAASTVLWLAHGRQAARAKEATKEETPEPGGGQLPEASLLVVLSLLMDMLGPEESCRLQCLCRAAVNPLELKQLFEGWTGELCLATLTSTDGAGLQQMRRAVAVARLAGRSLDLWRPCRQSGRPALVVAACSRPKSRSQELLKALLQQRAQPEARSADGWNALMWSAQRGNCEDCRLLLEARASANAVSADGTSPLLCAVRADVAPLQVVKLLLAYKADPALVPMQSPFDEYDGGFSAMFPSHVAMQAKAAKNEKKKSEKDTLKGWASEAELQRVTCSIEELAQNLPPKFKNHTRSAAPYLAFGWIHFLMALPYVVKAFKKLQEGLSMIPEKIFWAILSFLVCFFGGIFPATIAAAEAWNLCGGPEVWDQTKILMQEFMKVVDATKEDGKEDKDEKEALTPQQVIQKKMTIALQVMEPEKVSNSLSCIYICWIGVVGVLRLQFARTITLGEVIGAKVYKPVRKLEPTIESVIPEDYQKWVPVVTRWTCKAVAISLAWWIQRIISAVHSAIRGGMIFGEYLVDFLHEKGFLQVEHRDTYMDEAIGWSIACLGFLTQLAMGFQLPFVFNLVLWPVQLVEAFIIWTVSS